MLARFIAIMALGLFSIVVILAFGSISGLIVAMLWNYLFVGASSIIGVSLPTMTWLKGWMLSFLIGILFVNTSVKE
jgi:hypothetical protein